MLLVPAKWVRDANGVWRLCVTDSCFAAEVWRVPYGGPPRWHWRVANVSDITLTAAAAKRAVEKALKARTK